MHTAVSLVKVDGNQAVTRKEHPEFYHEFQRGVLLALKEQGKLTEMQYRRAEEGLRT